MIKDVELSIIAGTLLIVALCVFIILFIVQYKKAQKRFEIERRILKQTLLQTEIEIREQTLQNISRELHDNIGQLASLIKINLNVISMDLNEEEMPMLGESKKLLTKLISEVKGVSTSLKERKSINLSQQINEDLVRIETTSRMKVHSAISTIENLSYEQSIFLYRIFQECTNNVLKHAMANSIIVELVRNSENLMLSIKDNGIGINDEVLNDKNLQGNGIANLMDRSRIIGASITFESEENEGTTITLVMPIKNQKNGK